MKAMVVRLAVAVSAAMVCAAAAPAPVWTLARSPHFEVYSQAGREAAQSTLMHFEELRAFLAAQIGVGIEGQTPVRVVEFASEMEYDPYRLTPASDAFCTSIDNQHYIVMMHDAGVAAHEYAHAVLHSKHVELPEWLAEGLSELLVTAHVGERGSSVGGDLPNRTQNLKRRNWLPVGRVMAMTKPPEDRDEAGMYYAESWALTSMLALSPKYVSHFPQLLSDLPGLPAQALERDLRDWVSRPKVAVPLPGVRSPGIAPQFEDVSPFEARVLLAEVLMVSGKLGLAEQRYRELIGERPDSADLHAALGTIALQKGDRDGAREEWKRAIDLGVTDAALCFRYTALASVAGAPAEDIRPALERAIALRPDFDDARYDLALIEKNAGHDAIAVEHLGKMKTIAPGREYYYWSALADALLQLDRREGALAAARKAQAAAADAEQRAHALQLAYMAQTDLVVQLTKDATGRATMTTARAPHGTTDWNPFIEPTDVIRRQAGTLRSVECGGVTRLTVDTASGRLALAIPDLTRLAVRNGSAELTCGPQQGSRVTVVYAEGGTGVQGVLRGIEFQ